MKATLLHKGGKLNTQTQVPSNLTQDELTFLRSKAQFIRLETIRLIEIAKVGHYSSVFSAAEIFAALFYDVMDIRKGEPDWPEQASDECHDRERGGDPAVGQRAEQQMREEGGAESRPGDEPDVQITQAQIDLDVLEKDEDHAECSGEKEVGDVDQPAAHRPTLRRPPGKVG